MSLILSCSSIHFLYLLSSHLTTIYNPDSDWHKYIIIVEYNQPSSMTNPRRTMTMITSTVLVVGALPAGGLLVGWWDTEMVSHTLFWFGELPCRGLPQWVARRRFSLCVYWCVCGHFPKAHPGDESPATHRRVESTNNNATRTCRTENFPFIWNKKVFVLYFPSLILILLLLCLGCAFLVDLVVTRHTINLPKTRNFYIRRRVNTNVLVPLEEKKRNTIHL